MAATAPATDTAREKSLTDYRKKLLEHKELEARLKESKAYLLCYLGGQFQRKNGILCHQIGANAFVKFAESSAMKVFDTTLELYLHQIIRTIIVRNRVHSCVELFP